VIAAQNVSAGGFGLACADVPECPPLVERQTPIPIIGAFLFVLAKDIGDFRPMFVHSGSVSPEDSSGLSFRASNGLGVVFRCAVETRRYRAVV
jgi:hypothetical protein